MIFSISRAKGGLLVLSLGTIYLYIFCDNLEFEINLVGSKIRTSNIRKNNLKSIHFYYSAFRYIKL